MTAPLVLLALLATEVGLAPGAPGRTPLMVRVERVERHPLPQGTVVRPLPLQDRIELVVPPGQAARVARTFNAIRHSGSALCPDALVQGDTVVLYCRHPRLRALLKDSRRGKGTELRLEALKGVPPLDNASPAWLTRVLPLLADCRPAPRGRPKDDPLERGVCALARGRTLAAEKHLYKAALRPPSRGPAAVLLGELASQQGHPERAVGWYRHALVDAVWLLPARVGLCEQAGLCTEVTGGWTASASALPQAVAAAVEVRRSRLQSLLGWPVEGAQHLAGILEGPHPHACDGQVDVCQAVAWAAVARPGIQRESAADAYLRIMAVRDDETPSRLRGAQDASRVLEDLGVPLLAGHVLSALTSYVPRAELHPHLLRIARCYALARDPVRFNAVQDYARVTLGRTLPVELLPPEPPPPPPAHNPALTQAAMAAAMTLSQANLEEARATLMAAHANGVTPPPSPSPPAPEAAPVTTASAVPAALPTPNAPGRAGL